MDIEYWPHSCCWLLPTHYLLDRLDHFRFLTSFCTIKSIKIWHGKFRFGEGESEKIALQAVWDTHGKKGQTNKIDQSKERKEQTHKKMRERLKARK